MEKYDGIWVIACLVLVAVAIVSCLFANVVQDSEVEPERPYVMRYNYYENCYSYEIYPKSTFQYEIVFEAEYDGRLYINHDNGIWDEYEYKKGLNKIVHTKFPIMQYTYEFQDRVYYKWYYSE